MDEQPQDPIRLGTALLRERRFAEAEKAFRHALQACPDSGVPPYYLGILAQHAGRVREAVDWFAYAIRLKPASALLHTALGAALLSLGRMEAAVAEYEKAAELEPNDAAVATGLGGAMLLAGFPDRAELSLRKAVSLRPDFFQAWSNLAVALQRLGRFSESVECARRYVAALPDSAPAYLSLSAALWQDQKISQAIAECEQALRLVPGFVSAHNNLGHALREQGRIEEAVACYRHACELDPGNAAHDSNLIYALLFHPDCDPQVVFDEHRRWDAVHAAPLRRTRPFNNDRSLTRRLRIGYLSGNFNSHATMVFLENVLANHDHAQFEIVCYSDSAGSDDTTRRLMGCADLWRAINGMSDAQAAELVENDRVDILVDVGLHMSGNRSLVIGRKPAPIQVNYLAYSYSSGQSAMDYRITDDFADPPGMTERYNTETLIRLPGGFYCYRPLDDSPPVTPPPSLRNGHITFGCLNSFAKCSRKVVGAWSRILIAVPGSRLVLLVRGGRDENPHIDQWFAECGIDPARLEYVPMRSRTEYLQTFSSLDIALDPFPCTGHTTSCECLWMGVPMVTLAGATAIARMGASVLGNVGLGRLVAGNVERYVELAVSLARDERQLVELRRNIRPMLQRSPIMDAAGVTRKLEAACRQMWTKWTMS